MLRLLIIVTLILAAIPFFNKAKDYTHKKVEDVKSGTKKLFHLEEKKDKEKDVNKQ